MPGIMTGKNGRDARKGKKLPETPCGNAFNYEHTSGWQQLQDMVGLKGVKDAVAETVAYAEIREKRLEYGLRINNLSLHMAFKGNPGTGKSAVARTLGDILFHKCLLRRGEVIEVERADLVGEYIGHTAKKTREQVEKARGGILFVDEAYSLSRGGVQDFGKEAVDVLVKAMEDYREDFVLVLAGYSEEMDYFLRLNPGLQSRIPLHMNFPDYSIKELMQIASGMAEDYQYSLSAKARSTLRSHLLKLGRTGALSRGNARLVRNFLERAIRRQALRLVRQESCTREDLILLTEEDIGLES